MLPRRDDRGHERAEHRRHNRRREDPRDGFRIHAVRDRVEQVHLGIPHLDAHQLAHLRVQVIDVADDQIAREESEPRTDDPDRQPIAEEDPRDAVARRADALDDADVARLLDHDHVEDAEDQENGH